MTLVAVSLGRQTGRLVVFRAMVAVAAVEAVVGA